MCGDWNLNFMLDNIKIQEVKNLLESHNLTNIVRSPTRITPTSESLIDVVIINKQNPELEISVVDMGFSDHLAQVIKINTGKENRNNKIAMRRHLTKSNTEELKQLLSKESWNEVLKHSDVNASLQAFMDTFLFCFETAIPYKRIKLRERKNNRWLSKGLINSSKKMKMLNNLKRRFTLTNEVLGYIKKYQSIYKRVLKEAKKRDNHRYVTEAANKTKAMWQLINRKIGKIQDYDHKLELRLGNNIIKNPI